MESDFINYERIKEIVFLLWDSEETFREEDTQSRINPKWYKAVERVHDEDGLRLPDILKKYENEPNQEFLVFVHLDHNSKGIRNKGYHSFMNSKTLAEFPGLKPYFISRVDKEVIYANNKSEPEIYELTIVPWDGYYKKIDKGYKPQTVAQMKQKEPKSMIPMNSYKKDDLHFKYAIFTALYEEFKPVSDLFNFDEKPPEKTGTIEYKIGTLNGKNVVACFANKTGMTEAAVICTEMIYKFKPEYILMPGVCGGADETEFGEIIVADKVFLIGKGKIKDIEDRNGKSVQLIYNNENIDVKKIKRSDGYPLRIVVEELEKEIEAIEADELLISKLKENQQSLEQKINNPYKLKKEQIKISFAPIACSLSVIDKEGYFEIEIQGRERKTKAVEMESYGVARAARKAKGGITKFLIFKAVMDKTKIKTDEYREKAAYVSAQFLKYILEDDII